MTDPIKLAREALLEAKHALFWCGGSDDFSDGGKAREGWLKVVMPVHPQIATALAALDAIPQPAPVPDAELDELQERLKKRADGERSIARNNAAVAEALRPQMEAFDRHDGTHNTFAVRLGIEHKNCAENDEALAKDWDAAADALSALRTRLAEVEGALAAALAGAVEVRAEGRKAAAKEDSHE